MGDPGSTILRRASPDSPVRALLDAHVHSPSLTTDVDRYRLEGEQDIQPGSRRPRRPPAAIPAETVALLLQLRHDLVARGLDAVTLRVADRFLHIGVGRAHARTPVVLLVQDLDVRVADAATGELLRALTLDLSRSYQAAGTRRAPNGHNRGA